MRPCQGRDVGKLWSLWFLTRDLHNIEEQLDSQRQIAPSNWHTNLKKHVGFKHAHMKDWWVVGLWWQKTELELVLTSGNCRKDSRSCSPEVVSGVEGWSCTAAALPGEGKMGRHQARRMGKLWRVRKVFKFSVLYQCCRIFRWIWNKCFLMFAESSLAWVTIYPSSLGYQFPIIPNTLLSDTKSGIRPCSPATEGEC